MRLVRATLGGSSVADGGAALFPLTLDRLGTMLVSSGAAVPEQDEHDEEEDDAPEHSFGETHDLRELARLALDGEGPASVATLIRNARVIAQLKITVSGNPIATFTIAGQS